MSVRLLLNLKDLLLDFLFPKSQEVIALEALAAGELSRRIAPAEAAGLGADTFALFDYSHVLAKELVWEMKYAGNRVIADKLGELLYDFLKDELHERQVLEKERCVILLPMPVSDKRRYERGWNQAELLAEAIKKRDAGNIFKYLPRQLAKVRHTESQTRTASRKERLENLSDSMKVLHPPSVAGRFAVLVDDVTTTGATFAEAKRALRSAGARKVFCMAVAH